MATKRVQLTITDQRFFDDAQNKREAVRVWSLPWKLPQYIESWDSQSEQGKVWVKVPKIPANGSVDVYLYYGNPSAQSESDGEAVFEFFDDFSEDTIASGVWNVLGGSWTIENGEMESSGSGHMAIKANKELQLPLRMKVVAKSISGYRVSAGVGNPTRSTGLENVYYVYFSLDQLAVNIWDGTTEYQERVSVQLENNTYYELEGIFKEDGTVKVILGEHEVSLTHKISTKFYPVLHSYSSVAFDMIFFRKYAEQEPTAVIGGEEASDISGWLYRRRITITNPNDYDLHHFQVAIDLDGSNFDFTKANANGSDIRVAYASARYSLPYYIETWDTATPQAVIWVGIDSETRFFVELNPANTTDESDESVMNLDEATNYSLSKFEKYA